MTRADLQRVPGAIVAMRGLYWRLGAPHITSDGFVTANGIAIDPETGDDLIEDGFAVCHSFFLGQYERGQ